MYEKTLSSRLFDVINVIILGVLAFMCLFPLVHVIAVAFSSRPAVTANMVAFWPIGYTSANFQRMLEQQQFIRSFFVSVARTVLGSGLTLLIVILAAYPFSLSRGFRGRNFLRWFFLFAMLFNGGLIPFYLAMRSLHLLNNFLVLVLPGVVQIWFIIIMVNFFRSLPEELAEAAMIDGASHWTTLFRIYVPLSLPAITTILLFSAVDIWNEWFMAMVLMKTPSLWPMQTYLQTLVMGSQVTNSLTSNASPRIAAMVSAGGLRSAQIVLTTLPILILYPFIQGYFIKGLTLGAVKG